MRSFASGIFVYLCDICFNIYELVFLKFVLHIEQCFFFKLLNYVFLRVHSFCMNVPQFDVISLPTYSAVLLFMLTIYYQHFLSFVLNMC